MRKTKSLGLRVGIINVGKMTGKGRELADMMQRRKVEVLYVQGTGMKGSKAGNTGAGFKRYYPGMDRRRVLDRVMSMKLETEGVMMNVVSVYAP